MKKLIIVVIIVSCFFRVQAQKLSISVLSAYVFDDKFDYYKDSYTYYDGRIEGGLQWGVGMEYALRPNQGVELFYLRQDTYAPTTYQGGGSFLSTNEKFKVAMNYIMLGGVRRFGDPDKIQGYFSPNIGMDVLEVQNPSNKNEGSATKFAWGAKLGCDIALSPVVKIKLQAHLTSPVQSVGGGLFFGTGGSGVGLGLYSTVYQFALGGGLVFVPQKKKTETPGAVPEGHN